MKVVRISKHILAALACMAVLCCAFSPAFAESGANNSEYLTVGVPKNRCPVFYDDEETGKITGIGLDVMRLAAEETGYTVKFTYIEEETIKEALDNKNYDVVMPFGSAIPSAAGYKTIVSDSIIQSPFTLVTEKKLDKTPRFNDLTVGMVSTLGGVAETVRDKYPGIDIIMYETMDKSVKALRKGEVDALLNNSFVWSYVLQKPSYSDLAVQPEAMLSMDFRVGTIDSPEKRTVIERLNKGIEKVSSTQIQAVVLDHTSRRLYHYTLMDYLHEYGLFLLLIALLFIAVVIIAVQKMHALRVEHEERVQSLMDHDQLTGVLSMNGFRRRVEQLVHAHPDISYLIAYCNIINFKFINDSFGREAGDELLSFWARKSQEVMSDKEAIGRIDADHLVLLRQIRGEEQMISDEKVVIEPVRDFFINQGKGIKVQVCCGMYVLTQSDYININVDHMIDFARVAERRVSETRKSGYELYNPEEWESGKRVADIVGHLPLALKSGEIRVVYQPQVNYDTGEITGTEALCRWNHNTLGWLRPSEFIPTLEKTGLIYDMDCYIWDKVCQDLQRWNEEGKHQSVSVNLSRRDLKEDRNVPGKLYDLVQSYGLSIDQLRVEITESAFVEDPEILIKTTRKLREFGFQVEMDDFGSGYSSLNMLKEVPVDRIKLDLHFLTGAGEVEKSRIIVSHMIQMINDLGMSMIAEGVENAKQAEFLRSRGCPEMQGFYFYKPMPVNEFEDMILKDEGPAEK